jgi:monoamine oxidase
VLAKAGSAPVDSLRTRLSLRDGKLLPPKDLFREVRAAIGRTTILEKKDMSFAAYLERYLKRELSAEALVYARMLAEGYDAADTARASARSITEEWCGGGGVDIPQFRPLGGYATLISALTSALSGSNVTLQLKSVVRSVRWKRGKVEISGTHLDRPFRVSAPRAIVTLPVGVLKASIREPGAVRFTPPLKDKQAALRKLAAGPVLKVSLLFRTAFWEKLDGGRYCNISFFHSPQAMFPTFWTTLPVRTRLVVAWAGGPRAARMSGMSRSEVIRHALESFAALFGTRNDVDSLQGAWVHDWARDPYARGAYSHVLVGGDDAMERLAKPVAGTLFFAGEAADTEGEAGTVAGALQSGVRAAREALSRKR